MISINGEVRGKAEGHPALTPRYIAGKSQNSCIVLYTYYSYTRTVPTNIRHARTDLNNAGDLS